MNETGSNAQVPATSEASSVSPGAITHDVPHGARLQPHQPPGRCTRKALPFADEICRLHAMGYTLEAIRRALSEAGVSVSRSTVHREARRRTARALLSVTIQRADKVDPGTPALLNTELIKAAAAREPPGAMNTSCRRSKESAEAFFDAHPSNPLFPTKETS